MGYPRTISPRMRQSLSYITEALENLKPGDTLLIENIDKPWAEAHRLRSLLHIDKKADHYTIRQGDRSFSITSIDRSQFKTRIIKGTSPFTELPRTDIPEEMVRRATERIEKEKEEERRQKREEEWRGGRW